MTKWRILAVVFFSSESCASLWYIWKVLVVYLYYSRNCNVSNLLGDLFLVMLQKWYPASLEMKETAKLQEARLWEIHYLWSCCLNFERKNWTEQGVVNNVLEFKSIIRPHIGIWHFIWLDSCPCKMHASLDVLWFQYCRIQTSSCKLKYMQQVNVWVVILYSLQSWKVWIFMLLALFIAKDIQY